MDASWIILPVRRSYLLTVEQHVSHNVLLAGYVVWALVALATLGLLGWLLARRLGFETLASRLLAALVLGTFIFGIVHFFEHQLQVSYWFVYPTAWPWIPPWALAAIEGLNATAGFRRPGATSVEAAGLLHLLGNWVFFTGIIAMYVALRRRGVKPRQMRAAKVAFWVQLVHVIEHVSLTSSTLLLSRSIGMSTLFGYSFYLERSLRSSICLWWHFVINLLVVAAAVLALREFRRAGLLTTAASASADGRHEASEPKPEAEITGADRERHPTVLTGIIRDSDGQRSG